MRITTQFPISHFVSYFAKMNAISGLVLTLHQIHPNEHKSPALAKHHALIFTPNNRRPMERKRHDPTDNHHLLKIDVKSRRRRCNLNDSRPIQNHRIHKRAITRIGVGDKRVRLSLRSHRHRS